MQWASVALLLLKLLGAFCSAWERRSAGDAALAQSVALHLSNAMKALADAKEAANAVDTELSAHPERLRDDDGFRREP